MRGRGFLLAAAAAALAAPAAAQERALEVRFCPERVVRPYPLDSLRGAQGLLLHNFALVNRSGGPARVSEVRIELLRSGEVQDVRRLAGETLGDAVRSGEAVQAGGLIELVAFQFCDGRLLDGARIGTSATLAPGEALLVMQQAFAWRGVRDTLRVTAVLAGGERQGEVSASIAIDPSPSRTAFRWPLRGGPWLVGSGASFHTTHRWAIPEEFALDILAAGPGGRSHRGRGVRNRDFFAYGAEVIAAADGRVVRVITGSTEAAPMLRLPGEASDAYYRRISERQARNIAAGEAGLMGETVIIDHGNGEHSIYAHLVPGSIRVRPGQAVRAGHMIGRLGSSGNSTEPHLHFQVCDGPSGVSCAGIAPTLEGIELPLADGPRPIQSGDVVIAADSPR